MIGRVKGATLVVGDPVMLGLLEWHAGGRAGERRYPDIDAAAGVFRGEVVRWESLPGNAVAVADRQFPGFRDLVRETELAPEELERAYPAGWGDSLYRPFHREMLRRKWSARPNSDRPLIVYHHIPKCAGMSMFLHLNDHLTWNDQLVHLDGRARQDVLAAGCVPFDWKDPRELDRIDVLFGHDVTREAAGRLAGREMKFATCLRDPASRMVSHYNWEMHQRELGDRVVPEFEEWYVSRGRNWMTRWLGRVFLGLDVNRVDDDEVSERVVEALKEFWIVGTTDNFMESMRPVTEFLGLAPVNRSSNAAGKMYPNRFRLDAEWSGRIAAEHPLDVRLVKEFAE